MKQEQVTIVNFVKMFWKRLLVVSIQKPLLFYFMIKFIFFERLKPQNTRFFHLSFQLGNGQLLQY